MANNRKCFFRGSLVELCFRTEEGLPFIATPYMLLIVQSILARAQSLYPLTICHAVLMDNHAHLLARIENPQVVKDFVAYFKRETAHSINRFLGREKRTVWGDGYDSPTILDAAKAIERIVYIYTNPQRAHLVKSIEEYPNFSTWESFQQGGSSNRIKRIMRSTIPKLPKRSLSIAAQEKLAMALEKEGLEEYELVIEPDAWMLCFSELDEADPRRINQEIESRVKHTEQELSKHRQVPIKGTHALKLESLRVVYAPTKRTRRMICLASNRDHRNSFIFWFKALSAIATEAYQRWKDGDYLAELPPGMFWPGGRLSEEIEMPQTIVYA